MKINFDLKLSGSIENTLEWMKLTDTDTQKIKEKVKEYLLEQIDDNFETFYYGGGILDYNSDSLKFSFDFSENEKIILDNNVISDNIIIKSFTNRKNLPKNEKIYAIIDNGDLMDIEEAINKRIDFDKYIVCQNLGETKGRFIDNLIDCCDDETAAIVWVDIENKRWDEFENLIFGYQELKKEVKENNLGYFVYLEY